MFRGFIFATGIENSYPTVKSGTIRMDELEKCRHYEYWKKDFDLVQELNISFLRYGPPIHKTFIAAGKYDWEFSDLTFNDLRQRQIIPIVDLAISVCRTGLVISKTRTFLSCSLYML
jgi:hypothetical protein